MYSESLDMTGREIDQAIAELLKAVGLNEIDSLGKIECMRRAFIAGREYQIRRNRDHV